MRALKVVGMIVFLCGMAAAQATIIGGTASNWAPAYGVYAAPFVPLVVTPQVALDTVAPMTAGASSYAFGLTAGATNSTLSMGTTLPNGVYSQAEFYGAAAAAETANENAMSRVMMRRERAPAFDFVVGSWSGTASAAVLAPAKGSVRKATRTITNQDIDRFNQSTGNVKYDGKTEQIK